jgi:hypothetical protein
MVVGWDAVSAGAFAVVAMDPGTVLESAMRYLLRSGVAG